MDFASLAPLKRTFELPIFSNVDKYKPHSKSNWFRFYSEYSRSHTPPSYNGKRSRPNTQINLRNVTVETSRRAMPA